MFLKIGLGVPTPTIMRILMADCFIKKPVGLLCVVLVKVDRFIFLIDFIILDCEMDRMIHIILVGHS